MARIITTRDLTPHEYLEFPIFQVNEEVLMVDPQHPDFDNYKLSAQLLKNSLDERLKKMKEEVDKRWSHVTN